MARAFNVTLTQPAGYLHALALDDAASYLVHTLTACGHPARRTTNHIDTSAANVILCAHLLGPDHLAQLPADTIIFNSESLADPTSWPLASGAYRSFIARFHVWDYSLANLPLIGHDRASWIPFLYCRELAHLDNAPGPGDGLLFYGVVTPRRQQILDRIRAAGIRIDVVFREYGAQRDARLRRAVAVLNLHKTDDASAFEAIRCFYPLIQAVPVISEETIDPAADPFRTAASFVATPDLVTAIGALLADRETLVARARRFAETSALPAIGSAIALYLAS